MRSSMRPTEATTLSGGGGGIWGVPCSLGLPTASRSTTHPPTQLLCLTLTHSPFMHLESVQEEDREAQLLCCNPFPRFSIECLGEKMLAFFCHLVQVGRMLGEEVPPRGLSCLAFYSNRASGEGWGEKGACQFRESVCVCARAGTVCWCVGQCMCACRSTWAAEFGMGGWQNSATPILGGTTTWIASVTKLRRLVIPSQRSWQLPHQIIFSLSCLWQTGSGPHSKCLL